MKNFIIKPLSFEDLDQVARIHVSAFPDSTLSHFGRTLVKRYYSLNMSDPNECYAIGAFSDNKLMGFCFAGVFKDVKYAFLRQNWLLISTKLITKPCLFFNKKIRARFQNIFSYVKKERKQISTNKVPVTKKSRRFGILSIAVDPMFRSTGIGKVLIGNCQDHAMNKNFDVMELTVNVDNSSTIVFYHRLGWTKVLSGEGSWLGRMEKRIAMD